MSQISYTDAKEAIWKPNNGFKKIKAIFESLQSRTLAIKLLLTEMDNSDSYRNLIQKTSAKGDIGRFKSIRKLYLKYYSEKEFLEILSKNNSSSENFFTIALKTKDASFISYLDSKYTTEMKEGKNQLEKKQLRDAESNNAINMLEIAAEIQDELKKPNSLERSLSLIKKKFELGILLQKRKDIMDKLAEESHDSGNASSSDEESAAAPACAEMTPQSLKESTEHTTEDKMEEPTEESDHEEELSWGDKLARDIESQENEAEDKYHPQEYFVNLVIAHDFKYLEDLIGPTHSPYKDSCLGVGWKDIIDDLNECYGDLENIPSRI